jgi:transcriptional regulator with XRE-family HTH domain
MTQLDLATEAGISLAYVGRLEAGAASCTIDVLEKIAKALAVSVAELLPSLTPPDTMTHLRQRVQFLADRLVQTADRGTLELAAQFLARLSG